MKSPFRYFGGKSKGLKEILPYFPEMKGTVFVDLFGGGFTVMLGVEPKKAVVNDIWNDLICFWWAVRGYSSKQEDDNFDITDNGKDYKLYKMFLIELCTIVDSLDYLAHINELIKKCKDNDNLIVLKAVAFYLTNRMSWSGGPTPCETIPSSHNLKNHFDEWHNFFVGRKIKVWNQDFRTVLKKLENYESENFFIYADPPYVKEGKGYKHSFTEQDHIDLATMLKESKYNWIVSYDESEFIRDLYKEFKIVEVQWAYTCVPQHKDDAIKHELLIINDKNTEDNPILFSDDLFEL